MLKLFLDADQLVQLGDPFSTDRSGLDAKAAERGADVRDRVVRGLAAAVADDRLVSVLVRKLDRLHGARQRSDLVGLDEDRIGRAKLDALLEPLGVRREEVVADEQAAIAD